MMTFKGVMCVAVAVTLGGCAATSFAAPPPEGEAVTHAEHSDHGPRPYNASADAAMEVDDALSMAKRFDRKAIIVMGANWCHDSRGLAAHFQKPRFQTLIDDHYELVYVDVGQKNRNLDIARRFGLDTIVGTPTVFVTDSDGQVLNLDTAPTWRNAASRTEAEVWDYFNTFAVPSE